MFTVAGYKTRVLQAYVDGEAYLKGGNIINIYKSKVVHFSDPNDGELFVAKPKEMDDLVRLIFGAPIGIGNGNSNGNGGGG